MFVLEVIPFSRTAPPAPLSYRSRTDLAIGTLVSIPLRRKTLPGLVVGSVPVREAKSILKTASFTLSKSSETVLGQLPVSFVEAAKNIATYHATTLGAVFSQLLTSVLPADSSVHFWNQSDEARVAPEAKEIINRIEAPFIERVTAYKKTIALGTALLVVPTQTEADEWAALLKAEKPLVLSGKLTGKRREAALASLSTVSGLVISTPSFAAGFICAAMPRLQHIIIERMSAGSYVFPKRPYIDMRYALTEIARAHGTSITYGDYPLPLEYRKDPELALCQVSLNTLELIDVRPEKTEVKKTADTWQAIPEAIRSKIRTTLESNGRVALLAVRRGYSPTVVCRDCGTSVTDEYGRALSLATTQGKRVYRSNDGKITDAAEVFCKVCGGWNLLPLGIGVERLEEELRSAFPQSPLIRIDQDARGSRSLKKVREEILLPGTIILGTEIMLPFLSPHEPVELGIIASADALLALPFWRARERFVRIGRMLSERALHTVIATRHPEDAALSALTNPKDTTFWTEETTLRKTLSYPPFGTLIVFHIEGTPERLEEMRTHIRTACMPYVPHELPNQQLDSKNNHKSSLVLQLKNNLWPDEKLSQRLAHLSPAIRIHIDSEMLW